MPALTQQRCFNHTDREAASRCTACQRHFCRECVTLHGGLMICGACMAEKSKKRRSIKPQASQIFAILWPISLLLLWLIFRGLGGILINTPSTFHDAGATSEP